MTLGHVISLLLAGSCSPKRRAESACRTCDEHDEAIRFVRDLERSTLERAARECELVDAEEDLGSKGEAALRCAASIRKLAGS